MGKCKKDNIVLIGMPAVGKSTIGIILAKVMGYDFLDSDLLIQQTEKRLLADLIAKQGVDGFLEIENHINSNICVSRTVIATGGSAVYGKEAMNHLKETSVMVYLKEDYDVLSKRIDDIDGRGVVRREGQTLADLYAERCPLYETYADIIIEEQSGTPEQTLHKILEKMHEIRE
ncbi:MAG: shikimate kinase [Clostridia bacterium]|nr:shikimate kinase [Clostridia bacterium]